MDGACTKKSFHHLEIPPRKLLSRNLYHQQNDSPNVLPEETLFHKFLPSSSLDDESDPYASDHFRMYEFKIRKCTRSRSHDWTDCPFAHPGEKARRRCPRRFNYSGTICVDFRRAGTCVKGDTCAFAHGVFECWLHPDRYRTEACKDGKNCRRKICFFAHTSSQLRSLSPVESPVSAGHCAYCRCHPGIPHGSSPTSILDMEQVLSPPPSPFFSPAPPPPAGAAFSPVSRFSDRFKEPSNELMNRHAIFELMHSMKAMNMHASEQTVNVNRIWKDSFVGKDDQPSFFAFSPPVSGPGSPPVPVFAKNNVVSDSTNGPDLGWVNDLLT